MTTTATHMATCSYAGRGLDPVPCPYCDGVTAPACPSWCSLPVEDHSILVGDRGGVAYVHRHRTSDQDAPYLVRVEWVESVTGSDSDWPTAPGVYVEDAHGDDLTADQARAMSVALAVAADRLDAASA